VRNVERAPQQGSGSDGVLAPLASVLQQALSFKFFHVGLDHRDSGSHISVRWCRHAFEAGIARELSK
jgi:hypothetical protein